MKKIILFMIGLTGLLAPLSAGNVHMDISPAIGTRLGYLGEYVYANHNTTNESYTLSYLQWNMMPVIYMGSKINLNVYGLEIEGDFKFALPTICGKIQDSDWCQDYHYPDSYPASDTSVKTNFSEHTNKLENAVFTDVLLRYKFKPRSFFTISPVAGISYNWTKMTAKDGYISYGDPKPGDPKTDGYWYPWNEPGHHKYEECSGNVLTYNRADFHTWIGVGLGFTTSDKKWTFELDTLAAVFSVYSAIDGHLLRNLYYYDKSMGAFTAGKLKVAVNFQPFDRVAFRLGWAGVITRQVEGWEAISDTEKGTYVKTNSRTGADALFMDAEFSVRIFIF